ncbi:MAG: choice-of-anchor Q domain-containing protein, partial [Acidobacteriota bacterium]
LYVNFLGNLDLFNATVGYNTADNNSNDIGDGGGIFVVGGTVRPRHTIFGANVDGSAAGLRAPDCSGPVVSAGRNLFSAIDFAVCQTSGDFASDLVGSLGGPLDPGLEPCLEAPDDSNTSALNVLDDSPAVDAGDPAGCLAFGGAPLENDQAGNQRVWDGPDLDDVARCDLGAIELGAPSASFIFGDDFESGNLSAWTAIVPPPPGLLTQGPPKTPRQIFRESVPLRGGCGGGDA